MLKDGLLLNRYIIHSNHLLPVAVVDMNQPVIHEKANLRIGLEAVKSTNISNCHIVHQNLVALR